jgi:16S rRNA (cytidine1402-2'-O)-methyltransferase
VNASLNPILNAAQAAAADQYYPQNTLYVVATPIGNLADISLRALYVLQLVDVVACEDTRHSQALLRAYGIDKAPHQLLALHQHNEEQAAQTVLERLQQGQRVAYISDAGTPGISDPGARLVARVRAAQLRTLPLPGASSITTLLSAAGVVDNALGSGFRFIGFLPHKATERNLAVQQLAQQSCAIVLLEAPHRIAALAAALQPLGERLLTIGRELTKQFESIVTLPAQEFTGWLEQSSHHCKGEFTLVLHPAPATNQADSATRTLAVLLAHLPVKTAVKVTAELTGAPRNQLYAQALELQGLREEEE